jgi:hypothetical protein
VGRILTAKYSFSVIVVFLSLAFIAAGVLMFALNRGPSNNPSNEAQAVGV